MSKPNFCLDWKEIRTAPTDDSRFLVGRYELTGFKYELSHHDDPEVNARLGRGRGWNHRNGAFGGGALLWARVPEPKLPAWLEVFAGASD